LQQSEARFRDLFDDAPVAYHELDTEIPHGRTHHLLGSVAEHAQLGLFTRVSRFSVSSS